MANEALGVYKKMGVDLESDWAQGTITSATELLPLREDGIAIGMGPSIIRPARIQGDAVRKFSKLGTLAPKLSIPLFGYPHGSVMDIILAAFGTVVSTEVASFTVTLDTNDMIDFNEGGAELHATLTPGTYAAGATSAVAGSLCALIKAQLESAGAGTYTVSYSASTKKFTIVKSTGTFEILWKTGVSGSDNADESAADLLGFTDSADDTGALTYTADTATEHVYDHVFTIAGATTYGLSKGLTSQILMATGKVYDVLDGVVDSLKFSMAPNEELMLDAEVEARLVADSSDTLAAVTAPTADALLYSQLVFSVASDPRDVAGFEVTLNNNFKKDLHVNGQYRSRFPRNALAEISGQFTLDLADSVSYAIYDAMIAGTQPALSAIFTGATNSIKTGFHYTYTLNMYQVQYNLEEIPGGGGEDAPVATIPFECYDDGTNGALKCTVRNNESAI